MRPITHMHVESANLLMCIRHFLSERLLNRALHAVLDVIPYDNWWEWAAAVDINNINEGVDPIFDAIHQHMNSQTNFNYDVTWDTKEIFVWIMRQLNYIAKHGIPAYKDIFLNMKLPERIEGYWKLEVDPTQSELTAAEPIVTEI